MSSILEELKRKRAEEGKSYLGISTKNDYSSVEKSDKERQEQLKALEEAVTKLRTPYIDYKENPSTIQSISLEDESFSRPAGDTMQSNQGNNPSKLGPNLISGLGKAALTIDTTKDTAIAGVANQLANAKALGMEIGSISAEQLYNYAKGKHNITNTVAVTRLERSEAVKSAAPVAIMLDEIKKGTYKGTVEDIEKTLKYGNDVAYTKWYNQKIAPSVNRAQQSQAANTSMYGETAGGIMNLGANAVSGIGQFAANTVIGGPIYAGVMAGLSRDSSQNAQQIRNEGLDQVAKDIGVDVGLGALFSYLMGEGTGAINSAIQNSIPKSVLSKAGIIAKNVVAGAGGAYASVGTTGTLRNIYNKLQGREVSQEDALKPWWSTDTAIATFMGALFNGISGSRSDLAKAKEIRAVMEKQGELNARLSGLSRDAARQFEAGNQQGVETSYNSGKKAIEEFFNRNNLGKVTNTLKNEYLRQWFEYNYDLGIKYENLTNPSATNTTPRIGPSLPTVTRPTQQATVVPPPSTYTPSTPLTTVTDSNTIDYRDGKNHVNEALNQMLPDWQLTKDNVARATDFFEKHASDFRDTNNGKTKVLTTMIDDNFVKLTTTVENGKLWIDELYVEKQNQGVGRKVVEALKEYAEKAGLDIDTSKELPSAKGFWDKVLERNDKNGEQRASRINEGAKPTTIDNRDGLAGMQRQEVGKGVSNVDNQVQRNGNVNNGQKNIVDASGIKREFERQINWYEKLPKYSADRARARFSEKAIEILKAAKDNWTSEGLTPEVGFQRAEDGLGTTENVRDAGFVLPNGRFVDLSGKKQGLESNGKARFNHDMILPFSGYDRDTFIINGAPRIDPENGGIDLPGDVQLTNEQWEALEKFVDYIKENELAPGNLFYIDVLRNARGRVAFEISARRKTTDIINRIKKYYQTGEIPVEPFTFVSEPNSPEIKNENSTQGSFSVPEKLPKKILGSQRKFLKEFKQVGYIDINGNKIESVEDFVDLCQIFRDPLAETTRFVFLNDDDIVVGETAITSYSVNHVSWGYFNEIFPEIEKAARACNATKFYFMHNHPTGDVEASAADKNSSKETLKHFNRPYSKLKYLGDVIIDHNKYTHIKPLNDGKISITENIKMKTNTLNEIEQYMSDDGWTKMKINSRDMIAQLASLVTNKEDYSSLMLLNYHRMPMLLQELPNQFFYQKSDFLKNYIKDLAKRNGAAYACIGTTDPATLQEIGKKKLQLQDAVCYEPLSDGSINIVGSLRRAGKLGQKTIFKRANKHENVLPTKDSPKFDLEEARKARLEKKTPDKAAFKQRIVDELKDIPGVEKVYLSKENKQGNWGVYVKGKQKVVFSKGFPTDWSYETYIPAYENGKPTDEKYIKEAIDIAKEELKRAYAKKEPPKKLEPPKKKEQPTKAEKKQPAKRLEKKQPEPDKRLGFDAIDKDKEALEKANDKLRDELAKQKKEYEERLKKKDEALEKFKQTKKEQKEKQKLKLKKKEEQKKEEQRFKSATPKGKLRMLGRKIEKQTGYYEINDFPKLDELYEKEFGNTIRQTIKTLKTRDIYPYLPAKVQDVINTFADETYLKANWKTFDKYVKEALQIKELKDLVEKSDTPVAKRLLSVMQEHKSAPITIKNAKEMYDDLQILADIVELAQERLDYRRQPENWEKILDKSAEALEELEKTNTPKSFTTKSAKRERKFDNFKKLPETFQTLKTRIQAAFGGNPNSPLKTVWDWFEEGREREAMLDSKFAENFDGLVEKAVGGWKFAGELEKDFAEDAPYIDAGITGTNPKTGKPYEENAKLPRDIIMHIVASSKNDDNLMSFCKILLGTDYKGNPVYSNPGGYIVPNEYYMKRGKIGEAYEKGKKYVFTKKDIEHLEGMLTETEKKFVEAALRVGDITAQYGNEVSQKLIGRDLFSVKNYIRIIRDLSTFDGELIDPTQLDNLANATSDKYVGIGGILGRGGSLEGRNHRSTRPIYGESLKQSVENSFGGAKKYIAYALPLYDTDYILGGRLPDKFEQVEVVDKEPKSTASLKYVKVDEPPRNGADRTMYYVDNGDSYTIYKVAEKGKTMKQLLTNAGEEGFYDYYKQFVDGLVGRNKKYSKFASTRARVVLNANLRVAATQFFSYFQMGQFLNYPTSSMTRALSDPGTIFKLAKEFLESKNVDTSKLKGQRLVNRFIEYATYTNTQRGLGKFSDDVRYVEAGSTVLGRINAGKLLATVDKFTVDATFRALMYDIMADGTKFGSEEFFKQFKSRLYSIYQSNPQYSAIYRTPLQNKGTAISTALSQFQTVMLQGFNNASQAAMAHEYYKRQGNEKEKKKWGKIFKRTVSGLIISSLTLIALRDYLDQLAGKEKDEPYVKRITMSFIQNMLSYTIVGDEIFSAWFKFNNYDLTTNELSYFNTALDTLGDMGTLAKEPTPPNAIKLIKSLGQTLGLPTGSLENTFGILSNLTPGNAFRAYSVFKDNSKYERWLKNQDAIGTDFKTFYEISQAVKEKTLKEKYGYVEHSETDTYGSRAYAKGRAIMDVLGIKQGKNMTKEQKKEYAKWYNIFKD